MKSPKFSASRSKPSLFGDASVAMSCCTSKWAHACATGAVTWITHDPITGDHGLVIQWLDLHGKQCELAVTRDELHSYAGSLVPRLARGGLLLTPGEERKLLRYLSQFDPNTLPRWRAATRIGWIEDADRALVYMLPPPVGLIAVASHAPATMSAHNDGLLVLDEIHTCDAKDFAAVIYNMSGGKGRQALDRDRQLRHARKWRAMYLSTGEISVFRRLQADAKEVHAGQLLRLIDIPIEGGIIVTSRDGHAAHAEKLKASCGRFFGVAGPALIRELVANYEDAGALTGTVKSMLERYGAQLTPATVPPEQRRAIKRFALLLVAGELATKLGILDCTLAWVPASVSTSATTFIGAHAGDVRCPGRVR